MVSIQYLIWLDILICNTVLLALYTHTHTLQFIKLTNHIVKLFTLYYQRLTATKLLNNIAYYFSIYYIWFCCNFQTILLFIITIILFTFQKLANNYCGLIKISHIDFFSVIYFIGLFWLKWWNDLMLPFHNWSPYQEI